MNRKLFRSRAGFTLVETMISFGLIAIVVFGLNDFTLRTMVNLTQLEIVTSTNLVRMAILSNLQNDKAWKFTIDDALNSNLTCIRDQTICDMSATGPIQLRNASGAVFYNATGVNSGFAEDGSVCSTYNELLGSDECPLRMDLNFQTDCSLPCTPSIIMVTANFKYNPKQKANRTALANQNYSVYVIRKSQAQ